jgi:acyl-CoA synthetase (AMP-forming)/AMP-acid ligase II
MSTIPALLERIARDRRDAPAVRDGDVALTCGELHLRAVDAARALLASGIGRGDAVAIWAPSSWRWIVGALATHLVGGVLVPINTRYRGDEAAFVVAKSRARVLITVEGFLGSQYVKCLRESEIAVPDLDTIVIADGPPVDRTLDWNTFLARGASATPLDVARRSGGVSPDDIGDLMFTSGTTGAPKGVPCAHGQTLRAFSDWASIVGLRESDRYLVVAPFFHSFGYKAGWLAALITGAVIHPQPSFDVTQVLDRIARERITVMPGPPTLYQSILARPDRGDLSSLRLAVTGAANVPVELVRRMGTDLGFETVLTGYGLTETTGCATLCRVGDDVETIARTSGRAMPGVEVMIAPDGEVLVRGYNVMRGYLDDPTSTAETISPDGWLHTGDIGVLDAAGNLSITDRKKDMFIVGGFNAYPAEIENVLVRHPDIAQVAVVGAPDDRLGEVGHAFVVPRPGASLDAADLIAWSRERMANFKVPRRFEIVDALPLNASGKVIKYELRRRAR